MLYKHAQRTGKKCRLMVSQPRRIAALALMNRLRPELGNRVGMRMGHDTRDETQDTCLWFVTTGYLVRYLAHHPEAFSTHTHLIIDEVHERSIDGDLMCYLCKTLLNMHPYIRIILMSATIHTTLYKEYFGSLNELDETDPEYSVRDHGLREINCLSVGVRRFPVNIVYANNLTSASKKQLPNGVQANLRALVDICDRGSKDSKPSDNRKSNNKAKPAFDETPPQSLFKAQCKVAMNIIAMNKEELIGKAVLLFVSGYTDIEDLSELFTALQNDDYVDYKLYND